MFGSPTDQSYSVSELTHYLKHLLEEDSLLRNVWVSGEVSNLTYHRSGHVYFSVKDRDAQLSCVMFRSYAQLAPRIAAGDKIIVQGGISVYAPRGNYQLMVRKVRKQGLGDLYQRFLALKQSLQEEGLFDPAIKRPIPQFPETIALITSPTGAAVKDMVRTIARRYDRVKVIIYPTVVQGERGAGSIVNSLKLAQASEADVILLARGGGSLEDLWNFNEEAVARAIRQGNIPVICGVGHETDVTIADFAADLRASTPTAAAEHAVPEKDAFLYTLDQYELQIQRGLQYFIDFKRQVLDDYENRIEQSLAKGLLEKKHQRQILDDYQNRIEQALQKSLAEKKHQLDMLETQLQLLDSTKLLELGYTLTLKEGKIQKSAAEVNKGDVIETIFRDGRKTSRIEE
ncbi:MAG: exodeoxyribonuclease VII large subunit [Bacteroidota bacterium]